MKIYEGKVALVTGGASGIGRALCLEMGRYKAKVIVTDINLDAAEQVAGEVRAAGGQAWAYLLDVSNANAVQTIVQEVRQTHQRLDYMFNNAGIALAGEIRDMTFQQWQKMMDVNVWGVIYGSMAAYEIMIAQGHGHIVNMASVSGLVGSPLTAAYATTKYAVVGYSTTLRAEAKALGVNVSTVCPAFVQTNMYADVHVIKADKAKSLKFTPAKKMRPTDAAKTILKGVAKNKKFIVFPFNGRFIWWLYRLHPSILDWFFQKMLKDFRRLRADYVK